MTTFEMRTRFIVGGAELKFIAWHSGEDSNTETIEVETRRPSTSRSADPTRFSQGSGARNLIVARRRSLYDLPAVRLEEPDYA